MHHTNSANISAESVLYKAVRFTFRPKHLLFSFFLASLGLVAIIYFLFFTQEVTSRVAITLQTEAVKQRTQALNIKKSKAQAQLPVKQAIPAAGWISAQDFAKSRPSNEILEVNLRFDQKSVPILALDSIAIKKGYAPKYRDVPASWKLAVIDSAGGVLSTTSFLIPNELSGAPPLAEGEVHKPIKLESANFTLTVDLPASSTKLRIVDENGMKILENDLGNVEHQKNEPRFNSIKGEEAKNKKKSFFQKVKRLFGQTTQDAMAAGDGKLDLTLISANYTDMNAYHSDVDRITTGFLVYEPFKTRASQIVFHSVENTSDLNCRFVSYYGTDRELMCDNQKVFEALNSAGVPYDKVAVVVNESQYGGTGGRYDGGIAVSYSGQFAPLVVVHELGGHVIGFLEDEYLLYGTDGPVDNTVEYNCDRGQMMPETWKSMVGPYDFFRTCGYPNWYRPSLTSVMSTITNPYFNAVSQKILNEAMDFFSAKFSDSTPPTVTITEPAEGSTVSGIINFRANLSDNQGIAYTQLYIDNQFILTSYETSPVFVIYTTDLPNIKHSFTMKTFDSTGNSTGSSVNLVSNNTGRDIGDVNCDLAIDSVDSLLILRKVAGLPTVASKCPNGSMNEAAADIDRNGKIESTDALQVLRYVVLLPNAIVPRYSFPSSPSPANPQAFGAGAIDSDSDGLTDLQEAKYPCMNKNIKDATSDPDRDSIDNVSVKIKMDSTMEIILGSNPCKADTDGDGYGDGAEFYIGTSLTAKCGENAWPADINNDKKVTILDLTSFTAPIRRLDTSPGDTNFNRRWDLFPGKGLFAKDINLQDLTSISTLTPPMFYGQKAFNGPACTI